MSEGGNSAARNLAPIDMHDPDRQQFVAEGLPFRRDPGGQPFAAEGSSTGEVPRGASRQFYRRDLEGLQYAADGSSNTPKVHRREEEKVNMHK